MKIISITQTKEKIRLKVPFVTALREVHFAEFIRVKVVLEDGSFAYGEAPATEAITGENLESISKALKQLASVLLCKDLDEALHFVHAYTCGSSAKAALDMAIVMLMAKQKGKNLKEYFCIDKSEAIETDITISLGSCDQMLYDAKNAIVQNMKILKIKLGSDIDHAIAVTKNFSQQLPEAKLLIDANQSWTTEQTLDYLHAVKGCSIELLEQPLPAKEIDNLAIITQKSTLAILADEAVFTLADAKYVVEKKAADMINIKLMKCGGVTKAIEILEYAKAEGISCMLGSMIEGPYSINITIYLAFAYRDVVKFVDLDSPLLYEKLPDALDFIYKGSEIHFKHQPVSQQNAAK